MTGRAAALGMTTGRRRSMSQRRWCLLLSAALLIGFDAVPQSAQDSRHLRLSALLFDDQAQDESVTLWLRIENRSDRPMTLCRPYWGYGFRSADPNGAMTAAAMMITHGGCGDGDHDPWWLVLPGESRFDSFEVKGLSEPGALLEVDVELFERPLVPGREPTTSRISWSGRVADALAAGQRLKARAR